MNTVNHPSVNPKKLYYSIGEVATMFNVNPSLIRYWEKEFNIISPYKNKKGNRYFTKKDIDNFHMIYNLVKEKGYTLQGAKDLLKKETKAVESEHEIIKKLEGIKQFLLGIKAHFPQ